MLNKFFNVVDLNNDGYIDQKENTAQIMLKDCVKISDDLENVTIENPDGVIDAENEKNILRYIFEKPEQEKQLLEKQTIYYEAKGSTPYVAVQLKELEGIWGKIIKEARVLNNK